MCGRYTLTVADPAAVRDRFPMIEESIELRARYNIAPGDEVLAVTTDREGRPRGELLRWGLVPSWAERRDTGLKMINARVETVRERPAFRGALERFRCLIVADGFYEWQRRPGRAKQPFHITPRGGGLFSFAGLWSIWRGEESPPLRTCAILTTAANSAVSALHDRMPVILAREAEAAWLDPRTPGERLRPILEGLPAERTALRAVSTAVNDARCDGPECLAPPFAEAQPALF